MPFTAHRVGKGRTQLFRGESRETPRAAQPVSLKAESDVMRNENTEAAELLKRAKEGDALAKSDLVGRYRDRIKRMVAIRMDRRLQSRVDASDIVQDASLEATRRLEEYFCQPEPMDFFVWLRWIANDKLVDAQRFHLGAQKRQVGHEVSLYSRPVAEATSFALAEHLLGRIMQP